MKNFNVKEKVNFKTSFRFPIIYAIISFILAILGIVANIIVATIEGDTFAQMFDYIMYGYIAGFIIFGVFFVLGIIFLFITAFSKGTIYVTNENVIIEKVFSVTTFPANKILRIRIGLFRSIIINCLGGRSHISFVKDVHGLYNELTKKHYLNVQH